MSMETFYQILEIHEQAQLKEIKDAYKRKALQCHPDKNPNNPHAKSVFQQVSEAYETLIDTIRRSEYDKELRSHRGTSISSSVPKPRNWSKYHGDFEVPPQSPSAFMRQAPKKWEANSNRSSHFKTQTPKYSYQYWQRTPRAPTPEPWGNNVPRPGNQNFRPSSEQYENRWGEDGDAERIYTLWKKEEEERRTAGMKNERDEREERWKQEREKNEARRAREADNRKWDEWPIEQQRLLKDIVALDVEIATLETMSQTVPTRTAADPQSSEDENHTIFYLAIKLNSRKRKLESCIQKHARICKLQRQKRWQAHAEKAEKDLAEVRKEAIIQLEKENPTPEKATIADQLGKQNTRTYTDWEELRKLAESQGKTASCKTCQSPDHQDRCRENAPKRIEPVAGRDKQRQQATFNQLKEKQPKRRKQGWSDEAVFKEPLSETDLKTNLDRDELRHLREHHLKNARKGIETITNQFSKLFQAESQAQIPRDLNEDSGAEQ